MEIRRITGLPSKEEADKRVAIWEVSPGYMEGSGRSYQETPGWTAEAKFEDVAVAAAAAGMVGAFFGRAKKCPSPACGAMNLSSATHCSTCGTALL